MHMQQNQLSSLLFISLFPGQNADHVAFQTQQYRMIDRKKNFYLLLSGDGTLTQYAKDSFN